jgi:acylphosphatase
MPPKRAHVFIAGRVQGVSFRYYTQQRALEYGVLGWVRNLWDGRVEAVFEGQEEALRQMVHWCHRGPSSARVDQVDLNWEEPSGSYRGFKIRPTSE